MEHSQVNVSGGLNGRPPDVSTFSAPANDSAMQADFTAVVIPSSRERLGSPLSLSVGRVQKKNKEDGLTNMNITEMVVVMVVDDNTDPGLINVGSKSTAVTMPVANGLCRSIKSLFMMYLLVKPSVIF
ncbi:hypothetical protein V6N13_058761 [Hibiscus sabdariffa]|uniref:Uncharacterized protein n=1 Tax=Hibiscus sabdariffa TaxID=183260 RepID=A0ABR2GFR4_9ROSI